VRFNRPTFWTIYAQEKPKEAGHDAGLQLIWFNK